MRNSEIILVGNMKLDKSYRDVLSYSESQMLALCRQKQIANAGDYQFIKPGSNEIKVSFTYQQCMNANYIAFQNPYYDNKWFFAFIDDVEYQTEASVKIRFTIDEFSTWYSYWTPSTCYVIREHVNDDVIGRYTLPEQLETGDFIQVAKPVKINNYNEGTYICMAVSELPNGIEPSKEVQLKTINGVYSGLYYMIFTAPDFCTNMIKIYDSQSKADAIVSLYLVPKAYAVSSHAQALVGTINNIKYSFLLPLETTSYTHLVDSYNLPVKHLQGDGYTPKNNKLYTYPYSYFVLTNNAGIDLPMRYEDFVNGLPIFDVVGSITPGCSIRCVPKNYMLSDGKGEFNSYNYGIQGAKFPICAWASDTYTNWLTSNGVNIGLSIVSSLGQIGAGAFGIATGAGALAGAGAIANGITGLVGTAGEIYQHSKIPDQAKGNTSAGDIGYSTGFACFSVYYMGLRKEYAKSIDDFFTRCGYKINQVKVPNITGRQNWNFVQIADTEEIGYSTSSNNNVPASSMEKINQIFINGVTIWHNYNNLGNYSLNNSAN